MKRAILFRFHKNFEVCQNHLELIRLFNPNISVYGLYGGLGKNFKQAKQLKLDNIYNIPIDDWYWKWLNGDLSIRWWFKDVGYKFKFDMIHVFEWDMILLDSVNSYFRHIKKGIAITNKQPMSKIYNSWYWVAPKRGRGEWLELKKIVKSKYKFISQPLAGIFGGVCLSRKFLERYLAEERIGSLCNDEVRTILYAQAYGMPVQDTGMKNGLYGFDDDNIEPSRVYWHYARGLKAFHPVREKLDLEKIMKIKKEKEL